MASTDASLRVVLTIARRELSERLRNRWIWTVVVLVIATTIALGYLASAPVGVVGAASSGAVIASIVNLAVYLVPLLALVMGAGVIVDDKRHGQLDLLLAYPVTPGEYFAGSFVGHLMALTLALVSSFVPAGLILRLTSSIAWADYTRVLMPILGLGASFLALSFLISILSKDAARGMASSVLVWVLAVLIFDLVLVGALVGFGDRLAPQWLGAALLLNPADVFRLIAFSSAGGAASPLGLSTVAPPFSVAILSCVLGLWVLVPLGLANRVFRRRLESDSLI